MENSKEENGGQNAQLLLLDIMTAYEHREFQKVLNLINVYKDKYGLIPEIISFAEKATEALTAESFIKQVINAFELFLANKEFSAAEMELKKIRTLTTDYPGLSVLEQRLLQAKDKKLNNENEEDLDALLEIALLTYYQKNWDEATKKFREILKINPHHLKSLRFLRECEKHSSIESDLDKKNSVVPKVKNNTQLFSHDEILGPIVSEFVDEDSQASIQTSNLKDTASDEFPEEIFSSLTNDGINKKENHKTIENQPTKKMSFDLAKSDLTSSFQEKQLKPDKSEFPESHTIKINFQTIIVFIISLAITFFGIYFFYNSYVIKNHKKNDIVKFDIKQSKQAMENYDFKKARNYLKQASEIEPDNQSINYLLSKSYELEKKHLKEKHELAVNFFREAEIALRLGNIDKASKYIKLAIKEYPSLKNIKSLQNKINNIKLQKEIEKKNIEKKNNKLIKKLFKEAEYWFNQKEYKRALKKTSKILKIKPNYILALEFKKEIQKEINNPS